ncbi:hypothetical protein GCM10009612_17250 [Streptomyces beijiangensis]
MAEVLGVEDRPLTDQQVLALGEELVVGGDYTRSQPAVGEVDQFREGVLEGAVVGVRVASAVGGRVVGVRVLGLGLGLVLRLRGHVIDSRSREQTGPSKVFVRSVQFC